MPKILSTFLPFTGKSIPILILGILSTHLNGCNVCSCKKVACPAFSSRSFDKWFPYNNGQRLLFRDSTGHTDTITIVFQYKSNAYEAMIGCYNGAKGCKMEAQLRSIESLSTGSKFFTGYTLHSSWDGVQTYETVEFVLYNFIAFATGLQDTGLVGASGPAGMHSRSYTNFSLGATHYEQVQILETDTANFDNKSINKIYLSRNVGLIAYEEYPSGIRWVKQ
jgi:hypothetical protein